MLSLSLLETEVDFFPPTRIGVFAVLGSSLVVCIQSKNQLLSIQAKTHNTIIASSTVALHGSDGTVVSLTGGILKVGLSTASSSSSELSVSSIISGSLESSSELSMTRLFEYCGMPLQIFPPGV